MRDNRLRLIWRDGGAVVEAGLANREWSVGHVGYHRSRPHVARRLPSDARQPCGIGACDRAGLRVKEPNCGA